MSIKELLIKREELKKPITEEYIQKKQEQIFGRKLPTEETIQKIKEIFNN